MADSRTVFRARGEAATAGGSKIGDDYIDLVLLNEIRQALAGKKGKRALKAYDKLPTATKDAFAEYLKSIGVDFEKHRGRYFFVEIDSEEITIKVKY